MQEGGAGVSIEADIAAFNARLDAAIENTMQTDVLDAAKAEIVNQLNSYTWTMSRGPETGSEGLRDREQMVGSVWQNGDEIILEITDEADFQTGALNAGDTLDEVVTRGDAAYRMPRPRPFMGPAEDALGQGAFEQALEKGLRERGF